MIISCWIRFSTYTIDDKLFDEAVKLFSDWIVKTFISEIWGHLINDARYG